MSNGWCYPPICMDILGVKFLCHFQAINNEEGAKEAVCATLALKSILGSIEVVQGRPDNKSGCNSLDYRENQLWKINLCLKII